MIARNFDNWARRVEGWLIEAGDQLPPNVDRTRRAHFILTVMEGGLMQSRAADSLKPFDDSVAVLRDHFALLQRQPSRAAVKATRGKRK